MSAAKKRGYEADQPDRAVIDIGSNTVRLVVYSGSQRVPDVWLNEKVTAKLGRELEQTGRMPDESIRMALAGLARFAVILEDLGVESVQTVATAAVREADNGPEFLASVRAIGLEPQLLPGEEEARISAMGVIGAFPGASGVVADLGGGSLELVPFAGGGCSPGASLPLGTLRLPALCENTGDSFGKTVGKMIRKAGPDWQNGQPLYMVGGTWRAMAALWMNRQDYPLTDPHGLEISAAEAEELAQEMIGMEPSDLKSIRGISSSRSVHLPHAAALLLVMLEEFQPAKLVFSSWGLREGLLFSALSPAAREQDPLLAAIAHFAAPRGASYSAATRITAWTSDAASGRIMGGARLRLAATLLAMGAAHIEPNMRLRHSSDWGLDKRWVALDHQGRALITATLNAFCGKPNLYTDLLKLADEDALREAAGWGLAIRLCRRIGAGSRVSLMTSGLKREGDVLHLWLDASRAQLATDIVHNDLKNLADWLGCKYELEIGT